MPKCLLSSIFWRPHPSSSYHLCSHLNWESLQAGPISAPRWAHQRQPCVSLSVLVDDCVRLRRRGPQRWLPGAIWSPLRQPSKHCPTLSHLPFWSHCTWCEFYLCHSQEREGSCAALTLHFRLGGGRLPWSSVGGRESKGGWVRWELQQRKASDTGCCTNTAISNKRTHESRVWCSRAFTLLLTATWARPTSGKATIEPL